MTTDSTTGIRAGANRRTAQARMEHPAARSRKVALVLSVATTAGLMVSMATSATPFTTTADSEALPPTPGPTVVSVTRPDILLPVASSGGATATAPAASVSKATPPPIVLQPQTRVTVARSNGSR